MKKTNRLKKDKLEALYHGILQLRDITECKKFFRDLCTLTELQEFSERFDVAKQVKEGVPYRNIASSTGVSTATVTRVANWLVNGEGGYQLVLDRLGK